MATFVRFTIKGGPWYVAVEKIICFNCSTVPGMSVIGVEGADPDSVIVDQDINQVLDILKATSEVSSPMPVDPSMPDPSVSATSRVLDSLRDRLRSEEAPPAVGSGLQSTGGAALEIHQLLILSTRHLPESVMQSLDRHVTGNPYRGKVRIGCPVLDGYLFNSMLGQMPEDELNQDIADKGYPVAIAEVLAYARKCRCRYVLLDADGKVAVGLRFYEHS